MQTVTVKQNDSNTKIERYILNIYPNLSYGVLQKAFRKRDIKVNGTRIDKDYMVKAGDVLEIYITDDFLSGYANHADISVNHSDKFANRADGSNISTNNSANHLNTPKDLMPGSSKKGISSSQYGFTVVYEDENLLVVNKVQGIPVHPDKDQSQNTLIDQVRIYLDHNDKHPGKNCPCKNCPDTNEDKAAIERKAPFQPSLCHRLDRNTGGLVIIAKNQASHDILLNKIETREIQKYYKCLVKGRMDKKEARLEAYLWKDARKSRVFVSDQKSKGALSIITAYKVLEYDPSIDVSMLEVELITGRTHQIRAHMAFIGHPIIGDGKYGSNAINRMFGLKMQALWAYKLSFNFIGRSDLDYLSGKELIVVPDFHLKSH